jgi:hypothetical protein
MNRRDALKKLAAGGVVAAGAPMVLSSFDVAAAASPPGTSLSGVPESGQPLLFSHVATADGRVQIADASNPTCMSGTMTRTYEWSVHSYNVHHNNRRLQLRNGADTQTMIDGPSNDTCTTGCPTPYTLPSTTDGAITLRSLQSNPTMPRQLGDGDQYVIQVRITWQCSGNAALQAEYRLSGTFPNAPTVTNQSYTVL